MRSNSRPMRPGKLYYPLTKDESSKQCLCSHLVAILLDYHQSNMLHRAPLKDPKVGALAYDYYRMVLNPNLEYPGCGNRQR